MARSSDVAYETLLGEILAGTYAAGHRLREEHLAATLGLSRTPIREALLRLDANGLVQVLPNRGALVKPFAPSELNELYELRALLEGYGARRAAQRHDPEAVDRLRGLCDAMDVEAGARDPNFDHLIQLNLAFHRGIQEAAASQTLQSLLTGVILVPLVRHAFRHYTVDQMTRSVVQHHELVDAIAVGDGRWAESVMQAHILAARSSLQEHSEDGDVDPLSAEAQ